MSIQTKQKQIIDYFVKEKEKKEELVLEIGYQCNWDKPLMEQVLGGDDLLEGQYQYYQNQDDFDIEYFSENYNDQKQRLDQFLDKPEKIKKKNKGYPVGISNLGNGCNFSYLLQIIFYNPKLVEQILQYKKLDSSFGDLSQSNNQFMNLFQIVIANQLISNQQYFKPTEFYQAIKDFERQILNSSVLNENFRDIIEYFTIFLKLIDYSLSKNLEKQHNQQNIFMNEYLEKQYTIKNDNMNQIQLVMSIKHYQIYNFLYKEIIENKNKIKELPENLIFTIERDIQQNKKTEEKFYFPQKLYLDFVLDDKQTSKQASLKVQKYITEQVKTLPMYYQLNKQAEAFENVVTYYESQPMYEEFILKSLKFEHQKKVEELKKQFPNNCDILNKELQDSSKNFYQLAQIVAQACNGSESNYYLYQFNFCLNKWFKYNDTEVIIQTEEEVIADTIKNGIILIYLSYEQKKEVQRYQNELNEIDKIRDQLKLNSIVMHNLLNKIPKEIFKKVLEENEKFLKKQ